MHEVHTKLDLRLLYIFVCLRVRTYYVHNNYVTYIVAMRHDLTLVDLGNLDGCFV